MNPTLREALELVDLLREGHEPTMGQVYQLRSLLLKLGEDGERLDWLAENGGVWLNWDQWHKVRRGDPRKVIDGSRAARNAETASKEKG